MMAHKRRIVAAAFAAVMLLSATRAPALINPKFTPVHLLKGASMVLTLKLTPGKKGMVNTQVIRALLGKAPAKAPTIDVEAGLEEHAKLVAKMIKAGGDTPALLLTGKGENGDVTAWLHVGGKWIDLYTEDNQLFEVDEINIHMEGTWASSTAMLIKCIEHLVKAPHPRVPIKADCMWAEKIDAGRIPGAVHAAIAVDIDGKGAPLLHVAADSGDRLLRYDRKTSKLVNITKKRKLAVKSKIAAWGDFNGDGRLDLASWDGKQLVIRPQAADGTFKAVTNLKAPTACVGLATLDVGAKGRAGLVISSTDGPRLIAGGALRMLDMGGADFKKLGDAGACLVVDLDGDNLADILQPFEKGSLFYKCTKPGTFAKAVPLTISLGPGGPQACVGDYDADGRFDVFVGTLGKCRLWQNDGKLKFRQMLGLSGEIAYISKNTAFGGQTCDFNNDGRQDILVNYRGQGPHFFFNRGFRSFGHARAIDLDIKGLLAEAKLGMQAAVVADFTGDGAQDFFVVARGGTLDQADDDGNARKVVIKSGTAALFPRESGGRPPLAVRVGLSPKTHAGPIRVMAWANKRCLGAWNVVPGRDAFFARREPGPVVIKWQFPGGKPRTKSVDVIDRPERLLIEP
jgi:VCBS repeat protein